MRRVLRTFIVNRHTERNQPHLACFEHGLACVLDAVVSFVQIKKESHERFVKRDRCMALKCPCPSRCREITGALTSVKPGESRNARMAPYDRSTRGANVVEIVYFTLVGIGLYFASDWILERLETRRGSRFENRSIIFFVIITVLALVSFQLISHLQQP